jgi:hypothetical protein
MAHCHAAVESRHPAGGDVRVPGDHQQCGGMGPGRACREQPDLGPVRAGSRFRLVVPSFRMSLTYEVIGSVPPGGAPSRRQ